MWNMLDLPSCCLFVYLHNYTWEFKLVVFASCLWFPVRAHGKPFNDVAHCPFCPSYTNWSKIGTLQVARWTCVLICKPHEYYMVVYWLLVWNIVYFPYVGNTNSKWLISYIPQTATSIMLYVASPGLTIGFTGWCAPLYHWKPRETTRNAGWEVQRI